MFSPLFRFVVLSLALGLPSIALADASAPQITAPAEARDRIAALRAEIAHHDHLYYVEAAPEISDQAYDRLKAELRRLEAAFPQIAREIGPTAPLFGDDRREGTATGHHHASMGSLEKAYDLDTIATFDRRVRAAAGKEPVSYLIEPKYDGMAVSLVYEHGRFVRALSRGDGSTGEEITAAVSGLPDLPTRLAPENTAPALLELRGELYLPWAAFHRLNAERATANESPFATPRNLAVGTIRTGDPALVRERGLRLVLFAAGAWVPEASRPASQTALRETIAVWGFPVPQPIARASSPAEISMALDRLFQQRGSFPFPLDGLVLKVDDRALQERLGNGPEAPRWAIAYKFAAPRERTRLLGIDYEVGRTGRLTPVARLAPVEINGTTVTRASLHHPGEIRDLGLHVDDWVEVELAGEIIPQIAAVDATARAATAPLALPVDCPECGRALDRTGKLWRCGHYNCPARLRGRLEHFGKTFALPDFGPARIAELVAHGTVENLADLFRQPAGTFSPELETALAAARREPLARWITALGIPGLGPKASQELAGELESLADLGDFEPTDSSPLGAAVVGHLRAWQAEPAVRKMLSRLIEAGLDNVRNPAAPSTATGPLVGKVLVFTGRLEIMTRKQATARARAAGAVVRDSVSGRTDYVVVGEQPGSKVERARERGVSILTEAEFLALLGDGEL